MTLSEFKAWFSGFVEAMAPAPQPSPDQWATIQARVAALEEPTFQEKAKDILRQSPRPIELRPMDYLREQNDLVARNNQTVAL